MIKKFKKKVKNFEKGLTKKQKKLWKTLIFLVKFGIASIPIYLVILFDMNFFVLQEKVARQTNSIINFLGTNSTIKYCNTSECNPNPPGMPTIIFQSRAIGIDRACTGYRSFFALVGLMLAVPCIKKEKRIRGIFLALVIIYAANLIRLVSTFYLSGILDFDLVHGLMWREGMIAVVFISWILWLKKL